MDMIAHLLGAIALSEDRTLRRTIRLEAKRAIERELKGDRALVIGNG